MKAMKGMKNVKGKNATKAKNPFFFPASNAKKVVKNVKGKNAAKATQAKGKGAVTAMKKAVKKVEGKNAAKATQAKGKKTETWIYVNTSDWPGMFVKVEHVGKMGWEVFPRKMAGCSE